LRAELIFTNGTIHTLDPDQPIPEAVAVANGRILAVGALEEVERTAHANTRRIDLHGRTLMPGFNDAHLYLLKWGLAQLGGDSKATPADVEAAILTAGKLCHRLGITSVTDIGLTPAELQVYRKLATERRMPLRVNAVALRYLPDRDGALLKAPLPERTDSPWLNIDTVAIFADGEGSPIKRRTLVYEGRESAKALRYTEDQMRALVWDIHRAGLRAAIYATTSEAISQAVDAIEFVYSRLPSRIKHRIEHFALPTVELLQRSRYRLTAVTAPGFLPALSSLSTEELPRETVARLYPLRSMLGVGVSTALGSFAPIAPNANPLQILESATTRSSGQANVPVTVEQALTIENALPMVTRAGALATGEDHLKGTITRGKYADLVVLSGDPVRAPAERLTDLRAEMTVIDGHIVHNTLGE
jgi:predicted amidohydrolase YtcJ